MAVSSLQLSLRVSHAAAACPGSSSSQRAAFRLGGFWHPPSGRCGVDTTIPARIFRRLFWGQFSGSNCAALFQDRTSQGTPLVGSRRGLVFKLCGRLVSVSIPTSSWSRRAQLRSRT
jgi:hypothetical protein